MKVSVSIQKRKKEKKGKDEKTRMQETMVSHLLRKGKGKKKTQRINRLEKKEQQEMTTESAGSRN